MSKRRLWTVTVECEIDVVVVADNRASACELATAVADEDYRRNGSGTWYASMPRQVEDGFDLDLDGSDGHAAPYGLAPGEPETIREWLEVER